MLLQCQSIYKRVLGGKAHTLLNVGV